MYDITILIQQTEQLKIKLIALKEAFHYAHKLTRLHEVEKSLQDTQLWNQTQKIQELNKERTQLLSTTNTFQSIELQLSETQALLNLAHEEENAMDLLASIESDLNLIEKLIAQWELKQLFFDEMDSHNAYLEIQAGAGGTDAQDWADMLLRLYLKWGERRGFKMTLIEHSTGEAAGLKSATLCVKGEYAYGWLRTETGVHRLVRLSPFDTNKRRHTSFASVFVSPEIDDQIEIDIQPNDLRIDTYRASGAGGQHVQKTDSAIRITHIPTNIVVQCQSDRSQHRNREQAMKQLRAKLYKLAKQEQNLEQQARESEKQEIGWGSQIRSYILDDSRVKDLRTGIEIRHVQSVLDGHIDDFLIASLKKHSIQQIDI